MQIKPGVLPTPPGTRKVLGTHLHGAKDAKAVDPDNNYARPLPATRLRRLKG